MHTRILIISQVIAIHIDPRKPSLDFIVFGLGYIPYLTIFRILVEEYCISAAYFIFPSMYKFVYIEFRYAVLSFSGLLLYLLLFFSLRTCLFTCLFLFCFCFYKYPFRTPRGAVVTPAAARRRPF